MFVYICVQTCEGVYVRMWYIVVACDIVATNAS